jgi:hypothetical protein
MMTIISLSENDKATLKNLAAALQPFRVLSERLPLSLVMAFLTVAAKEDRCLSDYAGDIGASVSVASRLFADLGNENRWKEPGFGLIASHPDLMDARIVRARRTPARRAMAGKIVRELGR